MCGTLNRAQSCLVQWINILKVSNDQICSNMLVPYTRNKKRFSEHMGNLYLRHVFSLANLN